MNVRPARPEDARRIAEIHVETWRATYPGVVPQEVLDELRAITTDLVDLYGPGGT